MIEITAAEAHALFVESARYAIGRSTYASSETAKIIARHVEELPASTCSIIAKDIRDFDAAYGKEFGDLYYRLDVQPYINLLPKLDERAAELGYPEISH